MGHPTDRGTSGRRGGVEEGGAMQGRPDKGIKAYSTVGGVTDKYD